MLVLIVLLLVCLCLMLCVWFLCLCFCFRSLIYFRCCLLLVFAAYDVGSCFILDLVLFGCLGFGVALLSAGDCAFVYLVLIWFEFSLWCL